MSVQRQIDDMFEQNLFPKLRELAEMPDASTNEMFKVSNYLYWAKLSGLNLKFELDANDMNWIVAGENTDVWTSNLAHVD